MSLEPWPRDLCFCFAARQSTLLHLQQHLLAQWPGPARCGSAPCHLLLALLGDSEGCHNHASASHLQLLPCAASLWFSHRVVALQTLAEMHGVLRTHADIKMDNVHVAVKQRSADTAVTVLDFGLCHLHGNGGSLS